MNKQLSTELKNYLLSLRSRPLLAFHSAPLLKFCLRKVKKICTAPRSNNGAMQSRPPNYVMEMLLGIRNENQNFVLNQTAGLAQAVAPVFAQELQTLELASREFAFNGRVVHWHEKFLDEEDAAALHRWGWLLKRASIFSDRAALRIWGRTLVQNWTENFISRVNDSTAWDAYNASERICSFIFFSQQVDLAFDKEIKESMRVQADWLATHLEYYGEHDTFNHILNNARALYVYGHYFSSPVHRECAAQIFEYELPKIVRNDGFLREGSSHYHFLITRWVLEAAFAAIQFSDSKFIDRHSAIISKMVENCRFLLVFNVCDKNWQLPLIGDVSPDFSPEWLKTLPWSPLAAAFYSSHENSEEIPALSGWASIFPGNVDVKKRFEKPVREYLDSGWHHVKAGPFSVLFYARPESELNTPGHFHNDCLSVCLFKEGRPILIDLGRFDYKNDPLSLDALSARAHNSVVVDDLEVLPFGGSCGELRHVYGPLFSYVKCDINPTHDSVKIIFSNGTFQRSWRGKVNHTRVIEVSKKGIEMEDRFEGSGKHKVEQFFHFAPGLTVQHVAENQRLRVRGSQDCFDIHYENVDSADIGIVTGGDHAGGKWYFPVYGKRQSISSVVFNSTVSLPDTKKVRFSWEGVN